MAMTTEDYQAVLSDLRCAMEDLDRAANKLAKYNCDLHSDYETAYQLMVKVEDLIDDLDS